MGQTLVTATATEKGTCDYCGAKAVPIVDVATLCEPFSNLVRRYSPLEAGVNVFLFKESDPLDFGAPSYWTSYKRTGMYLANV